MEDKIIDDNTTPKDSVTKEVIPTDKSNHLISSPIGNFEDRKRMVIKALNDNHNPFLVAARDLLRAHADFGVPQVVPAEGVKGLHDLLCQEVEAFTQLCDVLNLRREHMLTIRYALCTAIDENIQRQEWAKSGIWSQHQLLNTFHQNRDGGKTVFLLIGRMASQPQEHIDVLEIIFHILSLGFKGHYSAQVDGERLLNTVRHRLFTFVSAQRESVTSDLSAHWRGTNGKRFGSLRFLPVWVSTSLCALILLVLFGWYKYQLVTMTGQLEQQIYALTQQQPVNQKSENLPVPRKKHALRAKTIKKAQQLEPTPSDDKTQQTQPNPSDDHEETPSEKKN